MPNRQHGRGVSEEEGENGRGTGSLQHEVGFSPAPPSEHPQQLPLPGE